MGNKLSRKGKNILDRDSNKFHKDDQLQDEGLPQNASETVQSNKVDISKGSAEASGSEEISEERIREIVLEILLNVISNPPTNPCPLPQSFLQRTESQLRRLSLEKHIDTVNRFNYAFVGRVGVGKSTLINSIRGLFSSNDKDFAPINESGIGECTKELAPYFPENNGHIAFFDFPGGGAFATPTETYFMDQRLYGFDFIIIVLGERITQLDMTIAKYALEWDRPFVFVRSQMDRNINSLRRREGLTTEEAKQKLRHEINEDFKKQLELGSLPENITDIYLVSKYGFREDSEYAMDEKEVVKKILTKTLQRRKAIADPKPKPKPKPRLTPKPV